MAAVASEESLHARHLTTSRRARSQRPVKLKGQSLYVCGMALALLAAFWLIVAAGLLFAPDDVLKASPAARRYGAIGCFIFAASCIIALAA